jgi:hypothetical protein
MATVDITGNVIPDEWFTHIKMKSGKPDIIAIHLLSDIVYWYRPVKVLDENTGKIVAYYKKFKADKLQRNYDGFSEKYGYTKDQVRDALKRLEAINVIDLEFRNPVINGVKFGNLLYIGLNVPNLIELSKPIYPPMGKESDTLSDLNPIGMGKESDTNTEITTETTTKDSVTSVKNTDVTSDPPKPKKERDPRLDHPAIVEYRKVMHLQIPEVLRDQVCQVDDNEKWKAILLMWIGRGYNPRNIAGMLEAYRNGGIRNNGYRVTAFTDNNYIPEEHASEVYQ